MVSPSGLELQTPFSLSIDDLINALSGKVISAVLNSNYKLHSVPDWIASEINDNNQRGIETGLLI